MSTALAAFIMSDIEFAKHMADKCEKQASLFSEPRVKMTYNTVDRGGIFTSSLTPISEVEAEKINKERGLTAVSSYF